TKTSNAAPAWGSCILATSLSTLVGTILPLTVWPILNCPVNSTPNQVPNSSVVLIARHTRETGACNWIFFSMLSGTFFMGNLLVAYGLPGVEPGGKLKMGDACFFIR